MGKVPHLEEVAAFKKRLSKKIIIHKLIFFGSFARGDYRKWSDIDLLVVSNDFKSVNKAKRPVSLYDHWPYLLPVDFLCYTPEEFERANKKATIVREAVREGIEI